MPSAQKIAESKASAITIAMFLVFCSVAVPGSVGIQNYQPAHDGASPLSQQGTTPANGGGFFFSSVSVGKSSDPNSVSGLTEILAQLPQGLPSGPSSQLLGQRDYIFARQGSTYTVFPVGENEEPSLFLQSSSLPQVWLESAKRRSRFRISVEILDLLKAGAMSPFEISFHLRLNTKRTKGYLKLLAEKELLVCCSEDGNTICRLTSTGWAFSENVKAALLMDL